MVALLQIMLMLVLWNYLVAWTVNIQLGILILIRACSQFDDDLWVVVVI